MHRRASTLLALLAAGTLLATGCADDGAAAPTIGGGVTASTVAVAGGAIEGRADHPAPKPDGDPARLLKVALLRPAGDGPSVAQAATDGVRAAATADGHVELAEITGPTADEVASVVQKLCDDRYDLVIGQGGELVAPLTTVAAGCPSTAFLTSGGTAAGHPPTANVADWSPSPSDVGYPLGVLVGRATAPGATIAVVDAAGSDPAERAAVEAFRRGVAEANPTAVVAGSQAAPSAAVVFCTGWTACQPAAQLAEAAGIPIVSGLTSSIADAPTATLAATTLDLTGLYRDAFHLARQQRLGRVTFTSTVEDGQVAVTVNPAADAASLVVPIAELTARAAELTAQLQAGTVKVPVL